MIIHRLNRIFLLLSFYQAIHIPSVLANNSICNKQMDFKVTLKGKALINHAIKTVPAIDDLNCQTKCFVEHHCISYSFDEQTRKCTLSDSDHIIHPEHLVDTPNAIYRSAQNTCNCKGKSRICRFNFVDYTHRCECKPGFKGKNCETDINECASSPCKNNPVKCLDKVNDYQCVCAAGFEGKNCQTDINECASNPCQNGGTCLDKNNSYVCNCTASYGYTNCEYGWVQVNPPTTPVCYGAKDNTYGKFVIPSPCTIIYFKFVYVSGPGVTWNLKYASKGYWGCAGVLLIIITDSSDTRISPFPKKTLGGSMAYSLPGVTNMDPQLTFPELSPHLSVPAGKEFRAWFGQDFLDDSENNNGGKTCFNVWILK